MKSTAVILILFAILAGIGAAIDYGDAMQQRALWNKYSEISSLNQLYHIEDTEHQDIIILLLACCAIASGLILFQTAKQRQPKPETQTGSATTGDVQKAQEAMWANK